MKSSLQSSGEGDNGEGRRPARSAGAVQGAPGPEPGLTVTMSRWQSTSLRVKPLTLQAICAANMRKRRSPSPPSTPADAEMDRQGLWSVEQAAGPVRKAGKRRRAKNVLQKLPEMRTFETAACQNKDIHPQHTPPSHTHLCLVDPRQSHHSRPSPAPCRIEPVAGAEGANRAF